MKSAYSSSQQVAWRLTKDMFSLVRLESHPIGKDAEFELHFLTYYDKKAFLVKPELSEIHEKFTAVSQLVWI